MTHTSFPEDSELVQSVSLFCAESNANDNEALCDQRVLERLAQPERKEYGELLLKMASRKTPPSLGTTGMANGAANIRRRIRRIVDFEKIPPGNTMISLCITLLLIMSCVGRAAPADSFSVKAGGSRETVRLKAQLFEVETAQEAPLIALVMTLMNIYVVYTLLGTAAECAPKGSAEGKKLLRERKVLAAFQVALFAFCLQRRPIHVTLDAGSFEG